MRTLIRSHRLALACALALLGPAGSAVAQPTKGGSTIPTKTIFEALELKAGQTVGEIGAGNGDLSIEAARLVGAEGKVFTSELGADRIQGLEKAVKGSGLSQITVVPGDANKTMFADACCDAIFMRNVYHHFADPAAMTASIAASLKPGGRIAVVDFAPSRGGKEAAKPADRANNDTHGVSATTVARELREAGLELVSNVAGEERWFMVVARKPEPGGRGRQGLRPE